MEAESETDALAGDYQSFYVEAVESTLVSASVFAVASLRSLARKGSLSNDHVDEILQLPMDGIRFRQLREKHDKLWSKVKDRDVLDNADAYKRKHRRDANLVVSYVGDENADRECVHYVGYDESREVIVCVFRGSVTLSDWMEDAKLLMDRIPNPLSHVEGQPETVGIHKGFRNYIHGRNSKGDSLLSRVLNAVGEKASGDEKVEPSSDQNIPPRIQLVLDQLRTLKRKFPSFPIYVQGHSLGGALALIASLEIASDPDLSKHSSSVPIRPAPVTCITVGNPKPGDGDFCRAIEYLERNKTLRCCVIHNTYDVVPMLATNVARLDNGFWHPGWRLLLYKNRSEWGRGRGSIATRQSSDCDGRVAGSAAEVRCCGFLSRNDTEKQQQSIWNVPSGFDPIAAAKKMTPQRLNLHDHREYLRRLLDQEEQLRQVRLDDLYNEMWASTDSPGLHPE